MEEGELTFAAWLVKFQGGRFSPTSPEIMITTKPTRALPIDVARHAKQPPGPKNIAICSSS
jgi:hypothetical protein